MCLHGFRSWGFLMGAAGAGSLPGFPLLLPSGSTLSPQAFGIDLLSTRFGKPLGLGNNRLSGSLLTKYNWEEILKLCKAEETIGNLCNNGLQSEAGARRELLLACSCFIITENLKQTPEREGDEEASTGLTVTSTWLIWFSLLSFLPPPLSSHKTQMPFPHKYFSWCVFFFFFFR